MTEDLIGWVQKRIDADAALEPEVGVLILAALEGADKLDEYLEGGAEPASQLISTTGKTQAAPPAGVFLRRVQVCGFRGIGRAVSVPLHPAPGLTVIAGRNGSGKSSISEGLEVLLTGATYRWKNKRSTQWAEQWRNIHHDGPTEVLVETVEEGAGPLWLRTHWSDDASDVLQHQTTVQRTQGGAKGPAEPVETLGWGPAIETYRPLMSYDELGGLLEAGPSALYDALSKVLGTEQLSVAMAHIKARLSQLSSPLKEATAGRKQLHSEIVALDDERAKATAPLLGRTAPDTSAIRELATGVTTPDHGILSGLRSLAQIQTPDPDRAANAAARLRSAVTGMAEAGAVEAGRRLARLSMRRDALRLHAEHGDQSCPVCTQGSLDDAWAETSRELVAREEAELRRLADAKAELDDARAALRALMPSPPAVLDRAPLEELEPAVSQLRSLWQQAVAAPPDDLGFADHVEIFASELAELAGTVRSSANAELSRRDDAWAPLAARVASWCTTWDAAVANQSTVGHLTAAEKWLKQNDTRLKNERMEPISEAAKHAWSMLRQESNVDLGELRLEGQATRRRVEITASVDGVDAGSALPVMSQGELHALTLALFLPRASLDESPFRFMVLDDPVQAMDPAKVDGLVSLLSEIAQTRQVVVFSHDDRLPAALRRHSSSARIFEVVRGADSTVTVTPAEDPTHRYLDDADALCRDNRLPDETLRRTLPGLLRMALESAARDRFYSTRLSKGESLTAVEAHWDATRSTSQRVSLAIYDEVRVLDGWLKTESRRKALGIATSGFHSALSSNTDPRDAVHHTKRAVDDVRAGLK